LPFFEATPAQAGEIEPRTARADFAHTGHIPTKTAILPGQRTEVIAVGGAARAGHGAVHGVGTTANACVVQALGLCCGRTSGQHPSHRTRPHPTAPHVQVCGVHLKLIFISNCPFRGSFRGDVQGDGVDWEGAPASCPSEPRSGDCALPAQGGPVPDFRGFGSFGGFGHVRAGGGCQWPAMMAPHRQGARGGDAQNFYNKKGIYRLYLLSLLLFNLQKNRPEAVDPWIARGWN
jgi:hypothetical protein